MRSRYGGKTRRHDDQAMKAPVADERILARVYKGSRRDDTYLFVPARERLERVPCALLETMGRLEFVLEIELHRRRQLARADVRTVMRNLEFEGYHLQMPPPQAWHGPSVH